MQVPVTAAARAASFVAGAAALAFALFTLTRLFFVLDFFILDFLALEPADVLRFFAICYPPRIAMSPAMHGLVDSGTIAREP